MPLTHLSLAWRPFLDPLDLHDHWFWLLLPTAFFLAMAYRAVRLHSLDRYWRETLVMTVQIVAAIIGLGIGFYALVEWVLPAIVPMKPL